MNPRLRVHQLNSLAEAFFINKQTSDLILAKIRLSSQSRMMVFEWNWRRGSQAPQRRKNLKSIVKQTLKSHKRKSERQCMKVKSESEVTQSCLTLRDPMDFSPPGSSVHGIFQARVLEWGVLKNLQGILTGSQVEKTLTYWVFASSFHWGTLFPKYWWYRLYTAFRNVSKASAYIILFKEFQGLPIVPPAPSCYQVLWWENGEGNPGLSLTSSFKTKILTL